MDLTLSDRQRQRQALAAEFASREVLPRAAALDRAGAPPPELLGALFAGGLMACDPKDCEEPWIAVEAVSRASAALGAVMGAHTLVCAGLARFGSAAQREEVLRALSTDTLAGFAVSGALGPDAAEHTLRAARTPSGWRLMGDLRRVQNAPIAGMLLMLCVTDEGGQAFLVPTDTPGLLRRPPDEALGLRAAPACTVSLQDCELPDAARLGALGEGTLVAQQLARAARLNVASQALGLSRAALERAVEHVRARRTTPTAAGQGTQFDLVDLIAEVEATELLVRHAVASAQLSAQARPFEGAQAALHACETALRVCHGALRIVSTEPLESAYDLERYMRDAHAIGHATPVLRAAVARDALEQG